MRRWRQRWSAGMGRTRSATPKRWRCRQTLQRRQPALCGLWRPSLALPLKPSATPCWRFSALQRCLERLICGFAARGRPSRFLARGVTRGALAAPPRHNSRARPSAKARARLVVAQLALQALQRGGGRGGADVGRGRRRAQALLLGLGAPAQLRGGRLRALGLTGGPARGGRALGRRAAPCRARFVPCRVAGRPGHPPCFRPTASWMAPQRSGLCRWSVRTGHQCWPASALARTPSPSPARGGSSPRPPTPPAALASTPCTGRTLRENRTGRGGRAGPASSAGPPARA